MKQEYSTFLPENIHFGCGTRTLLASEILNVLHKSKPRPRAFLVSSKSVRNTEIAEQLIKSIPRGMIIQEHIGIPHDPPLESVNFIIECARFCEANLFIALGGGSVIDATKTAALLYHKMLMRNFTVADIFREQGLIPPLSGAPVIALPTTAGTGAEITKNAVLTDTELDVKRSISSPKMVPTTAIIDPIFTLSLPKEVTANSGLDALSHAIESFASKHANNFTKPLAAKATKLLLDNLLTVWQNGNDINARTAVAEASMIAAIAFSQSGLGAAHGLAHPIGHRLNLPHGLACAVLLPKVMAFNFAAVRPIYDNLASLIGRGDADALLNEVTILCKSLNVPEKLNTLESKDFDYIITNCRSGSMKCNPKFLTDQDVCNIIFPLLK